MLNEFSLGNTYSLKNGLVARGGYLADIDFISNISSSKINFDDPLPAKLIHHEKRHIHYGKQTELWILSHFLQRRKLLSVPVRFPVQAFKKASIILTSSCCECLFKPQIIHEKWVLQGYTFSYFCSRNRMWVLFRTTSL